MSGSVTIQPGYLPPDGQPITEAQLREIASPTARVGQGQITDFELNLPLVQAALGTNSRPNILINGNFSEDRWTGSTIAAPAGSDTVLALAWFANPTGAAITYQQDVAGPDGGTLFSAKLVGATGATAVDFGQNIARDISALIATPLTFNCWIYNNTGAAFTPSLILSTADAANNFTAVTQQGTAALQTCVNQAWTHVSATFDATLFGNMSNGLRLALRFASGVLAATGQTLDIARAKLEVGQAVSSTPLDLSNIIDGSVSAKKLAANAVTSTAIAPGAVTATGLGNGAVTPAALATGALIGAGGAVPVGAYLPYGGLTAPSGWLFGFGQAVSRTTYALLFAALTISRTGNLTSGSTSVTGLSDTSLMSAGMPISGAGIAAGTTIATIVNSTSITLSANATATLTASQIVVAPNGVGDGSTTFNVPDFRGRTIVGRDNMGGTAASRITTALAGFDGTLLGAAGGDQRLQAHTHSYSMLGSNSGGATPGSGIAGVAATTGSQGAGASQNVQPTIIENVIVFAGV